MVFWSLQHSTSDFPTTSSLHITLPKPSPPLSPYPAETKSSEQWQAIIQRAEDRGEAKKRAKQTRSNMRGNDAERRPLGANGGGAWELWEEFDEEEGGEDDDDDGVVRGALRRGHR